MKTNRSLMGYILLTIITCGIYPLFFWHGYVRDVNQICAGDGRNTNGIVMLFVLSLLTLGIYGFVWEYGMQNRLRDNAQRYNAGIIPGGGSVLGWQIFGSLLFGIGSFVAMYIQIDSLNRMAYAYTARRNSGTW